MIIRGIQKVTLLDYPGKVACTLFTGGCNFRCPFCQNSELVLCPKAVDEIPMSDIFAYLNKRKGLLDGVCITGGEPLLEGDIEVFMREVRSLGYLIKLDTNGYLPDKLEHLISCKLLDYVAMDIKSCRENYALVAGLPGLDISRIEKSIELLKKSGIPHEFRTTVVHELHTAEDVRKIGLWLAGEERYYIQKFADSGEILCPGLSAPTDEELASFLEAVKPYIPSVSLRGV